MDAQSYRDINLETMPPLQIPESDLVHYPPNAMHKPQAQTRRREAPRRGQDQAGQAGRLEVRGGPPAALGGGQEGAEVAPQTLFSFLKTLFYYFFV